MSIKQMRRIGSDLNIAIADWCSTTDPIEEVLDSIRYGLADNNDLLLDNDAPCTMELTLATGALQSLGESSESRPESLVVMTSSFGFMLLLTVDLWLLVPLNDAKTLRRSIISPMVELANGRIIEVCMDVEEDELVVGRKLRRHWLICIEWSSRFTSWLFATWLWLNKYL